MENTSSSSGESEDENAEGCGMEVVSDLPPPKPTDSAPSGAMLSTRQRKAMEVRQTPRPLRGSGKTGKIKVIEPTRMSGSRSTASSSRLDVVSAPSSSSGGAVAQDDHVPVSNKAQRLEAAPAPIPSDGDLLDDRDVADTDELYSENERALTQFIKLHPMLSLDATNERTLTAVAELSKDIQIETRELEIVSKTYDDDFLRPANSENGERECVNGEKCVCRWLSIFRYGEGSNYEFVCREYMLPSQQHEFKTTGKYSKTHGKCLLCTRYFTSYIYVLARNSPTFSPTSPIHLQAFANKIYCESPQEEALSHTNEVGTAEGYRQSVMLFVDERWSSMRSARSELGTLIWKPIVRFNSRDYVFKVDDSTSKPYLLQVNMGKPPEGPDFVQPSSSPVERMGAAAF